MNNKYKALGRADMQAATHVKHETDSWTFVREVAANARKVIRNLRAILGLMAVLAMGWTGAAWAGATTTTLTSTPNPGQVNQSITFTATVTGNAPTGNVTFYVRTPTFVLLGTRSLVNGVATLSQPFNSPASYSVAAQYGGDANNLTSTANPITQTITPATSTTVLTSNHNPSAPNQSVALTATVTGISPGAYVRFYDGGVLLNNVSVVSGVATLNYTFTTLGAHNLTANYVGDSNNTSSSGTLTQNVAKATTATTLSSSANPSAAGVAVTLTANVTGSSPGGTVTFMDGATALASRTLSAGAATLSYTFPATGTHSLTAVYGGDANNNTSTSAAVNQSVAGGTTTTALTISPNPSAAGQTVTLTANVTGASPTGTVRFMDGTTNLGTSTLSAGTATFSYTFATAGTHSLTAVYGGDANNATSTSAAVNQTVNAATTATTLSATPSPSAAGQATTLTATVTGAAPSGTVTFKDGTTTLGTGTLTAGAATLSYTFATTGTHSLTAVYGGDANNATSTSTAVNQTVNPATTTTTLAANPSPSTAGQAVTLTANVAGLSPTGTVTFNDGATTIGTGTLTAGAATLSYTFATAGTHSPSAVYGGDANNATSTSVAANQTVNTVTTATALSASPSPSNAGQAVTLTATVTGLSPTGTVTFMDGATTLGTGTISAGTATLSYTFNTTGAHSLTAAYGGDANNTASTSAAFNQTVNATGTTTTSLAATPSPSAFGQVVTLTATVTGGSTAPTGTVTFLDGTTTLGTGTLSAGTATLSYTFNTVGAHSLTASYAGDANNMTSTSTAVAQTVNTAPTTTTVASGQNPSAAGQSVTFTATVAGVSPTGTVTFKDGVAWMGQATLTAGTAGVSYVFDSAGTHNVTATYSGDSNNATSNSTLAQTVNKASPTLNLTSSINPSNAGQNVTLTATLSGSAPLPSGTVTFMDGPTILGIRTPSLGTATFVYAFATTGAHSLTAVFAGDANNNAATSPAVAQAVNIAASTTTLTSNLNPALAGQNVTLTATVAGASPTGAVTFLDGGTAIGTGTVTSGKATLSYAFTTAGTHSLTASYLGDANNTGSTSTAVAHTVNPGNTTTTLTSGANPSTPSQAVTLTATVSGVSPTGTVTFKDGATTLGTGTLASGVATLSYTFAASGMHSVTAVYSGDANNAASTSPAVSQYVMAASTTTLTSNTNPSGLNQPVRLTATVTGASPTGAVTFQDGGTTIGTATLTSGVASLSYAFTTAGTHSLTASYAGDGNNTSGTSAAVSQSVQAISSVVLNANPSPSGLNQAVTLTATVTGAAPTGTVTFLDGTTTLGTTAIAGGTATLSYTFTTAGTHSLTAAYGGDANNPASTSPAATQNVVATAQVNYIYSDHLDTPRQITDAAGNLVWQWDNSDPFGANAPNENPNGAGQFSFNLRFPGQYADKETNTYYNVNRDYDPAFGRYVESDPIGLAGGINTFAYVGGNPLRWIDLFGLDINIDTQGLLPPESTSLTTPNISATLARGQIYIPPIMDSTEYDGNITVGVVTFPQNTPTSGSIVLPSSNSNVNTSNVDAVALPWNAGQGCGTLFDCSDPFSPPTLIRPRVPRRVATTSSPCSNSDR